MAVKLWTQGDGTAYQVEGVRLGSQRGRGEKGWGQGQQGETRQDLGTGLAASEPRDAPAIGGETGALEEDRGKTRPTPTCILGGQIHHSLLFLS